jgi:hypothetical protein
MYGKAPLICLRGILGLRQLTARGAYRAWSHEKLPVHDRGLADLIARGNERRDVRIANRARKPSPMQDIASPNEPYRRAIASDQN